MMAASATRIPVVYNKTYKFNGLKSYVYALNKFGFAPTVAGPYKRDTVDNKLVKIANGTSKAVGAADQQNDSFYTCPVSIGTPAQVVHLDFDSGSSDLWVKTPKTASGQGASTGTFDHTKSSTWKPSSGSTWDISYGDGSAASGSVGTDVVQIGSITIQNQAVEIATKLSSEFKTESSSGLLGLAWGNINTVKPQPVQTPVQNMISQDDIPSSAELFTVYLGSVADNTAKDGFYTFGTIDENLVKQAGKPFEYVAVDNSEGFWMFNAPTASIGGNPVDLPATNKAIADTGTTLMLVSDAFVQALYNSIEGATVNEQQGGYVFPKSSAIPEVTVQVGNATITIEKEQIAFQDLGDGTYFGGIQSAGNNPFDIWGDVFLKNTYAVFDIGNKRFGVIQRPTATTSGSATK